MPSKTCLKCGHVNEDFKWAPDAACPGCGAIYAKVEKADDREAIRPATSPTPPPRTAPLSKASGYIQSNLLSGERVIHVGHVHWFIFVPGALMIILGFFVTSGSTEGDPGVLLGVLMVIVGGVMLIKAAVVKASTELAVTSRRVIAKTGFIRRDTVELNHNKVESFQVSQGILGRIFGYGTIVVCGTGSGRTPIPSISDPLEFRRQAVAVVDDATEQRA